MSLWIKSAVGVATVGMLVLGGCALKTKIKEAAAPELKCDPSNIKVRDVDRIQSMQLKRDIAGAPPQAIAEGCGDRILLVELCAPGARAGSDACSWVPTNKLKYDAIIRRSSFDLSCEPGLIKVQYLDAQTVGVNACASQVTYIWSCPHDPDLYSAKCTWIMNNETLRRAAPVPPAAPAQQPAEAPPPEQPPIPPGDVNM